MTRSEMLNVSVTGPVDAPVVVFVHGFGCGQHMWRHVAPAFTTEFRVVLLDLPGSGDADPTSYDSERHGTLEGYRDDLAALLDELDLRDVTLVGHSVSAMIAALVQIARPELVDRLVLVTPSARYIDAPDYVGGHSQADIDELLELMSRNHLGWQDPLASMVGGGPESEARTELEQSFCRTRPDVAAEFASVTFRGDNRADLPLVSAPTLVLQSSDDIIAPEAAGLFVRDAIRGAAYATIETRGHCPHLTAPEATTAAIRRFLDPRAGDSLPPAS